MSHVVLVRTSFYLFISVQVLTKSDNCITMSNRGKLWEKSAVQKEKYCIECINMKIIIADSCHFCYNSSDKKKEDDENECWYYCT